MKALDKITAIVAPLDRANVDTDAIIPKQFLKSIKRTGFGDYLFDEWRFLDPGTLEKSITDRQPNPEFILNREPYKRAQILLAQDNFGCGSSREHAPWALADFGFRVIIAPSYADIFYNNCFKNGILPIRLSQDQINELFAHCAANPGCQWTVDLVQCQLTLDNDYVIAFSVDAARRESLLEGLDDIALVLKHKDLIKAYEDKRKAEKPWLFSDLTV